jgi:hypothetical protein
MQMNCKFAIFVLVNICMSLFTAGDVFCAVGGGLRGSDYEIMVAVIKLLNVDFKISLKFKLTFA